MRNQLVEFVITLIVVLVLLWVLAQILPLLAIPAPWGGIVLVILGAAAVVYALRALKG